MNIIQSDENQESQKLRRPRELVKNTSEDAMSKIENAAKDPIIEERLEKKIATMKELKKPDSAFVKTETGQKPKDSKKESREKIEEQRAKLQKASEDAMKRFSNGTTNVAQQTDIELSRSVLVVLQEERNFMITNYRMTTFVPGIRLFDHTEAVEFALNRALERFGTPQERVQVRIERTFRAVEEQNRRLPTLTEADNRAIFDLLNSEHRATYRKNAMGIRENIAQHLKELEGVQKNTDNSLVYRTWAAGIAKRANAIDTDLYNKLESLRLQFPEDLKGSKK